ncbi:unnamed protein product [Blepharisma stoltei]|uniref:Arrestin-like N-terminal domain-containing protein n=1 Tax=Blepharisma stoltei TaxID=1481888 RepID=A0AAU9JKL7_9CILI|nr:unnamed protein product [Blepharisma stoltei]
MEDSISTSDTFLVDDRSARESQNYQFLHISLDSLFFTAGDNLSGDILLNLSSRNSPSLVSLKVLGIESVKVIKPNGQTAEEQKCIFKVDSKLQQWAENTPSGQFSFPFTFKTPQFSPASFSFSSTDPEGNQIFAKVEYTITAEFISQDQIIISSQKEITLRNKNSRLPIKKTVSAHQAIKSCFCFSQGYSTITLANEMSEHSTIGQLSNFKIDLKDSLPVSPISMVVQVIFDINLTIPGDKEYFYSTIVTRIMPNIKHEGINMAGLRFEADLDKILYGDNPCSNDGSLFKAEYKAQVFVLYNVGCRTKKVQAELDLHVNPRIYEGEELRLPNRWSPRFGPITNLIVENTKLINDEKNWKSA